MLCYLVIAFLDWQIGVFQQTVVTVYCIMVKLLLSCVITELSHG